MWTDKTKQIYQTNQLGGIITLWSQVTFNPFSAGTNLRRQILTSKVGSHTESIKYLKRQQTHTISIRMKRKELTKTFMLYRHSMGVTMSYIQTLPGEFLQKTGDLFEAY